MNNQDALLFIDTKISKLLDYLKFEEGKLHDIMVSELKLKRLGVSSIQINRNKNSILSS